MTHRRRQMTHRRRPRVRFGGGGGGGGGGSDRFDLDQGSAVVGWPGRAVPSQVVGGVGAMRARVCVCGGGAMCERGREDEAGRTERGARRRRRRRRGTWGRVRRKHPPVSVLLSFSPVPLFFWLGLCGGKKSVLTSATFRTGRRCASPQFRTNIRRTRGRRRRRGGGGGGDLSHLNNCPSWRC